MQVCTYGNLRGCLRQSKSLVLPKPEHMKKTKPKKNSARITSRHISIFVPAGSCILSSIIGSYKVLSTVNALLRVQDPGIAPPFVIRLVGLTEETNLYDGAFSIHPHTTIDKVDKTDLVIIPALSGDYASRSKTQRKSVALDNKAV